MKKKLSKLSVLSTISIISNNLIAFASPVQKKADALGLIAMNTFLVFLKWAAIFAMAGIIAYLSMNNDENGAKKAKIAFVIVFIVLVIGWTLQPLVEQMINAVK